ncbi:MAG: hypothetical protein CMC04_05970 [Flavobacteriaceae bacterium]|nr:hypothetical protein [Flavobacteriaceae bacterium]
MSIRIFKIDLIFVLFCFVSCNNNTRYNSIVIKDENTNISVISSLDKGKAVYDLKCASCHGSGGIGIGEYFPPLANTDYVKESTDEELYSIIKRGINGEIIVNGIVYNGVMPPIDLNDADLRYVVEYIKNLNNE